MKWPHSTFCGERERRIFRIYKQQKDISAVTDGKLNGLF